MSPAEYVFGKKMNDMLPTGSYWTDSFGDDWKRTMAARKLAIASRHERYHEKLSEHTKELPPLHVNYHVAVITDLEIQDPDFQESPSQPPPPTTSVSPTTPSPRRSMRSNAGKTSKYDEYIKTVLSLANTLCSELPHHSRYLTEKGGDN